MASYNRVILVGNVTRAVELKHTPSGTAVTEIGLAVSDRRKDSSGQWVDETTFVDVTLWARTAEVATEYLSKGSPVLIEGRLKLDSWKTSDGQNRYKLGVVCDKMQMLGASRNGRRRTEQSQQAAPQESSDPAPEPAADKKADDDIPF